MSRERRREMVDRQHPALSAVRQCALLGISRSSLYYRSRGTSSEDLAVMKLIDQQYLATPFYGSRRMAVWLKRQGRPVSRKRVQRLMRSMGLQAIYRRPRTSQPASGHKVYPYLLGGMEFTKPNQVWAADITYLPMARGFLYLVAIMDWYSRYVLAWRLSNTLDADFCVEALEKALSKGRPEIFNTDQGSQFTGEAFTGLLEQYAPRISMDGKGRYTDNIFVERLWRTVKYEEVYLKAYSNAREAKAGLNAYFRFYNTQRPHQALGYRTPAEVFSCGSDTSPEQATENRTWGALSTRLAYHRKKGNPQLAAQLRKEMQQLPHGDPYDPEYRRLRYVRYADDFVLGFIGPKAEAGQIKESLETFLRDTLKLELSKDKTLITHATSQAARFLGYELVNQQANDKHDHLGRRGINGNIGLRVPAKVIEQHCQAHMRNGKPTHRNELLADDDYTIVSRYQAEFRGVVQYYLPAYNVSQFRRLQWVMGKSLAKTLAGKHKSTARKMFRRYKSTVQTEHGERACLQVVVQRGNGKRPLVARFGGIPLKRNRQAVLVDQTPTRNRFERNELIQRLLADTCELCGSTEDINVHHVRALRDLNVKGQRSKPTWAQVMAARRRKTLVVCRPCHLTVHGGSWNPRKQT